MVYLACGTSTGKAGRPTVVKAAEMVHPRKGRSDRETAYDIEAIGSMRHGDNANGVVRKVHRFMRRSDEAAASATILGALTEWWRMYTAERASNGFIVNAKAIGPRGEGDVVE